MHSCVCVCVHVCVFVCSDGDMLVYITAQATLKGTNSLDNGIGTRERTDCERGSMATQCELPI